MAKAHLDGDVAQAADWYRLTVESGKLNSGEVEWSLNALLELAREVKSLALLSSDAKTKKP